MLEPVMGVAAEAVFGYVLAQTGGGEKLRALLKRDPQRLAFQLALTRTYATSATNHPQWTAMLFDEHFLTHSAAPLLARSLLRNNPPTSADLAQAWADQFGSGGATRSQTIPRIAPIAADFLPLFDVGWVLVPANTPGLGQHTGDDALS